MATRSAPSFNWIAELLTLSSVHGQTAVATPAASIRPSLAKLSYRPRISLLSINIPGNSHPASGFPFLRSLANVRISGCSCQQAEHGLALHFPAKSLGGVSSRGVSAVRRSRTPS